MCGINGFFSKKRLNDAKKRIEKMNEALYHRGPDAGGCSEAVGGRLMLGQRRLSIIDINRRSNQPMWSASGDSVLVFNGEIYNFAEIKVGMKYDFRTNSDTEVLLAGLELEGANFIEKCNGMFAFAFFDKKRNHLLLGRDRLGIKPLYYYADKDKFVFSSEVKGILSSGLVEARFNADAVDEYLGNRYVREPYTFFEKVYQVPAGCYLELKEDFEFDIKQFWDLPTAFNMYSAYDETEIYDQFKVEVFSAIKRRTIADVPLGTYLSGGIDSSIISAVCAMNTDRPLNTYTIGFAEMNEFSYAQQVSRKYHTKHHEILMNDVDYFGQLEELIFYKDAPLGVPNEIPLALMSKKLKNDITVVLSGEGADELMGGYGRIFRASYDYENVDCNYQGGFYEYFIKKYEYVPREMRDKYLKIKHSIRYEKDNAIKKEFLDHDNRENVFRFFHKYHVKGLLQRVDTTTMYASVEARVPFLDHKLIEFSYKSIPYELKLKWNSDKAMQDAKGIRSQEYSEILDQPKYLLRKLGLELLPENVVMRKKMGFPVPLNNWLGRLEHMAADLLKEAEWFNHNDFNCFLNDCKENSRYGQMIWMFVNVELFRKLYFDHEWRY